MFNSLKQQFVVPLVVGLAFTLPQQLNAQNTDFDKKVGAENAKVADAEFGIYDNQKMNAYVQAVGKRLVDALGETPFEFKFVIADEFIPNAFALPGGYIYVTRGILALVNTEDELACVMAHEITHVTERHSVHQLRRRIIPAVLMLPGEIVGYVAGDHVARMLNAPIAITSTLTASSYSRKQETEADTKGVALAAKAGYDPSALKGILNRLSNAIEFITNEKEKKGWLDDHPFTPDRVTNINEICKNLKWEKKAGVSDNALNSLDGLLCFDSPQKGIFNGSVFIHPEMDFTITFPKDWKTQNASNAVAAERKDKKAGLYLGLENPTKTPAEYAKEFEQNVSKKRGYKAVVSEARGDNGYLVVIADNSSKQEAFVHVLWIKIGNNLFKLIGLAPKMYDEDLKACAKSLRQLKPEEKTNIPISVMRVVKASGGETVEALSKQNGNTLKPKAVEVINGVDGKKPLKAGQQVKIVKKEIYSK